jgi:hypothetical protein
MLHKRNVARYWQLITVAAGTAGIVMIMTTLIVNESNAVYAADGDKPFLVVGSVKNDTGNPMAGVEVTAYAGVGTLQKTGASLTGIDGNYEIEFGPGMHFKNQSTGKWDVGIQAAIITARKASFYEVNLNRQGDLHMAESMEHVEASTWATSENSVFRGKPVRVDFFMSPAAIIRGRLVDKKGDPIAGRKVSLKGNELPPASSVFWSLESDPQGKFIGSEVPLKAFWFELYRKIRSKPHDIKEPGEYEFKLVFDTDGDGSLVSNLVSFQRTPIKKL